GEPSVYTPRPPYAHTTYSPWFDEWFQRVYGQVKDRMIVTEDRCYVLHQLASQCLGVPGDYAEAGVYRGGTARLIAQVLAGARDERPFHLLDTFAGMPALSKDDPSGHTPTDFADTSLEGVRAYLNGSARFHFHPGVIPQTFGELDDRRFAFVH